MNKHHTRARSTASRIVSAALAATVVAVGVAAFSAPAVADTQPTDGPAWTCSQYGYLFQTDTANSSTNHQIFQVDLASGASSQVGTTPDTVNAVGFNTTDDYMYGWDITKSQFVRIASDGSLTLLGDPTKGAGPFNTGDMDASGHLYVVNQYKTTWYEIDFAAGSSTYGQVLASGNRPILSSYTDAADWSWVNGALYSVQMPASGDLHPHLVKFTPGANTSVDLGVLPFTVSNKNKLGVVGTPVFGATYTDANGYVYAANNLDGSIYRIDTVTLSKSFLVTAAGPATTGNDGARCASSKLATITVTKQVAGRANSADQFTVGLQDSAKTVLTSATTTGTSTTVSTANWPVTQSGTYTITDAMANGSPSSLGSYVGTISCIDRAGSPVATGGSAPAWTLTVVAGDDYSCTVTNTPTVSVQVNKAWVIQNSSGAVLGTYHVPSQLADTATTVPAGFSSSPTLTGVTDPLFGAEYAGFTAGQSVTVGEDAVNVPSGCTVSSQKVTAVNGSALGTAAALPYTGTITASPSPNTFSITNTVTCDQSLTLVKNVAYGSLAPTSWNLIGTGPSGSLPGPNGETGSVGATTVAVTPNVSYALDETSSTPGAQNYVPTAAGWECGEGSESVPVKSSAVTVGYGQAVTCTITNTTAEISVLKHIQDPSDGLSATQFNITMTPPSGLGSPSTVTGSETATAANTFEVKPGATYTVAEQSLSSSTAYLALGLQQSVDGGTTWTAVSGNQITATAGTQVLYRFVNESVPRIALPLTGGVGTDVIAFWAIALFASAAALLSWQLFRRRRGSQP